MYKLHSAGFLTPETLCGAEYDDIKDDAKAKAIEFDAAKKSCIRRALLSANKPEPASANGGLHSRLFFSFL